MKKVAFDIILALSSIDKLCIQMFFNCLVGLLAQIPSPQLNKIDTSESNMLILK